MPEKEIVYKEIKRYFGLLPTGDQEKVINHLSSFLISKKENPLYLLKGYAGTGKTSLTGAFVKMLYSNRMRFVLMAPTGRAAKVLAGYTGFAASTLHRRLYRFVADKDGVLRMTRNKNKLGNTVFIVDEASMISDESREAGSGNLLDDLMNYVFSQKGNRLLLIGDTAQLPPVGTPLSPALDIEYLKTAYNLTAYSYEMTEVMRQTHDSGILTAATILRKKIENRDFAPPFFNPSTIFDDVEVVHRADEFEEYLQEAFYGGDTENSVIVCRTNKRANLFNRQVRSYILQRENLLEAGDRIMVVKNNYYWLDDEENRGGFIANGDMAEVIRVIKTEEMYGFHFANAEIRLTDYPEMKEISVMLLTDVIDAEGPSLPEEQHKKLFDAVMEDYMDIPSYRKRVAEVRKNPYYNALQIKFAYAMTCHKTQGGQWPHVFIDQGYVTEETLDTEYLRWLYTAVTRATKKVFLVNFNEEFFNESAL